MDRDVAPCALAAGLKSESAMRRLRQQVEAGMTLQTKLPALPANQKHAIRRAVRTVARGTALDLGGRVLVHIRPSLLHMALNTGLCLSLY